MSTLVENNFAKKKDYPQKGHLCVKRANAKIDSTLCCVRKVYCNMECSFEMNFKIKTYLHNNNFSNNMIVDQERKSNIVWVIAIARIIVQI